MHKFWYTDSLSLSLSLSHIVEPLTHIFNLCISHGTFPASLKEAKVVPIPKTQDHTSICNYRPISILSSLSKPLERHIHKHLLEFLERNDLLSVRQSGFRPNHSCHSALTRIVDKWLSSINDNLMSGAVFLDMQKAFDLVDHTILVKKLEVYHLGDNVLKFFNSYLQHREQKVYAHGQFSRSDQVRFGVPQGSILGPLLFILFINDLPLHVSNDKVDCDLFADDASLHAAGKSVADISHSLQGSLTQVSQWCASNHMLLHPKKTKSMLITTRQKHQLRPAPLQLRLDDNPIQQVSEKPFLGVCVDDQLKWESHIDTLCKTIARNTYLLSKLKHITDTHSRKLFFLAHIKSHVDYASTIWDGCSAVHMNRLNSLYKRAVRMILPEPIPTTERMIKLNILNIHQQLSFNKCVFVHKIVFGKAPPYLSSVFNLVNLRSGTSRNKNLPLPLPRLDLFKSSLSFAGAVLWNSLPPYIKCITFPPTFKRCLRQYLSACK